MNITKKVITGVAASTLLLSSFSGTSALASDGSNKNEGTINPVAEKVDMYTYTYKGVLFEGDSPLTNDQLESMYVLATSGNVPIQQPSTGFSTFALDPGSNAIRVEGPHRQTYKNGAEKFAVDLAVAWIASKLPLKLTKHTLFNYYFNKITGWASGGIKPVYIDQWVTRSWSDYWNMYLYHATLVNYTDSTFKTVKNVQYWEVNRSTSPNLTFN
jgi:hypothetical protein